MCFSSIIQIVYGIVCFISLVLTIVAIVTPGWTNASFDLNKIAEDLSQGILPFSCNFPNDPAGGTTLSYCSQWYDKLPGSEKAVIACMCLAVAVLLVAFIYNIFTICACCCKGCLLPLLAIITLIADILLAIAIVIYAIDNSHYLKPLDVIQGVTTKLGYSFYMACGALALSCINTLLAGLATCCAAACC